ncbi:MAG: hypothetical protein H6708_29450 [Kofleriaceae bacterium]|nr:hypothetical protein [Kofleriaceae bacterium]
MTAPRRRHGAVDALTGETVYFARGGSVHRQAEVDAAEQRAMRGDAAAIALLDSLMHPDDDAPAMSPEVARALMLTSMHDCPLCQAEQRGDLGGDDDVIAEYSVGGFSWTVRPVSAATAAALVGAVEATRGSSSPSSPSSPPIDDALPPADPRDDDPVVRVLRASDPTRWYGRRPRLGRERRRRRRALRAR